MIYPWLQVVSFRLQEGFRKPPATCNLLQLLLLSEIKQNLGPNPCCGSEIRVSDERLVYVPVYVQLNIQLTVHGVAYVWPYLDVDVSIRDRVHVINFPLYGPVIGDAEIESEVDIVLHRDRPAIILKRQLHIVLNKTNFKRPFLCIHFCYLCVRNIQRKIPLCFILEPERQLAFCSDVHTDKRRELFGDHYLTDDVNRDELILRIPSVGKGSIVVVG